MRAARWYIVALAIALTTLSYTILNRITYSRTDSLASSVVGAADATAQTAQQAFRSRRYQAALDACGAVLKKNPTDTEILLIAGESASRLGRYPEAIGFYDAVPSSDQRQAALARWAAGEVHLQIQQMSPAIQKFEASLQLDPDHAGARERLVYLLNLLGRRWEAASHLRELVRRDQWSVQHLLYLGNLAKPIENEAELQQFLRSTPEDRLPELGLARIRLREGRWDEADRHLQQVLRQHPNLLEAHVQQGKLRLQQAPDQLPAWHANLPEGAEQHPGIWMIRGRWAHTHSQPDAAARCYAEALQLDPDRLAALNALAQVLHERGRDPSASPLLERAEALNQLVLALEQILSDEWSIRRAMPRPGQPPDPQLAAFIHSPKRLQPIQTAARQTRRLGREMEADAWTQYAAAIAEANPVLPHPATRDEPAGPAFDLAWAASRELPIWPSSSTIHSDGSADASAQPADPASLATAATAKFETIVGALDFQFFNSRTDFEDGRRMFEMTGGGIGILDYDRDGWPDVFLAQGCTWPADGTDTEHCDQLRRNLGNEPTKRSGESSNIQSSHRGFLDVTTAAGIAEAAFGQGVAIGDVNSDGFDDIYVCNVGVNQLWINRGDGTFGNAAARFEKPSSAWTSSAAIADLNGDGTAEIYDANYVQGPDVFSRRCLQGGKPRTCSPLNFQPAPGRLLTVGEDGLYHDVGGQTLDATIAQGNALGLVVMRLPGQTLPSLFIANDQVANLMLIARPDAEAPLGIRLRDEAVLRGLAFDAQGNPQACMGVAADDLNGDGTLDLFVTNYYDESNTLYLQQEHGSFRDATGASGLVAPSLKMLGFGTQALDAQLDGTSDLVVLNGHIDDMTHMRRPFAMAGQFFQGAGGGRFHESAGDRVGSYFKTPRLGRALATLDVDRDGRPDLVAAELDGPTELLRNTSPADHFLCLQLAGVSSHRDAIGCEVVATIGDKTITKQLTAGCGYMVSNQKQLWFGCGTASIIDQLDIHWPSGRTQTHRKLPTNSHWLAVENQSQLTALPLP